MTRIEYAAKLLRIEAYIMEARANVLFSEDQMAIGALLSARKEINYICENILSPDETRMYLAK